MGGGERPLETMERLKRDAGKTGKTGRLLKRVAGDSIWSIAGLTLMNLTAQFAIYPLWNRQLGNEKYGRILFLIAAMNILAVSMGSACNYGRMKESTGGKTFGSKEGLVIRIAVKKRFARSCDDKSSANIVRLSSRNC